MRLVLLIITLLFYYIPILQAGDTIADTEPDSLHISPPARFDRAIDRISSTRAYQMTYIGIPLIAGGFIVKDEDEHFRNLRNDYLPEFRRHFDDYLQYLPAATMIALKIGGVKGRSSWGRMITSDVFSAAIMVVAVNSLKSATQVMRPDGSSRNSFPSGHTATAFMAATMMHKEYGERSPWYSIGAYSAATATGLTRELNNKHWLSDVMVGAGIGILSTEIGYFLADLIFKDRGITRFSTNEFFNRMDKPSFLGIYLGFNVIPGTYRLPDRSQISLSTGSNAGIEGACFFNPYIGAGGRFSASNMPVSINDVPQNSSIDVLSIYGGAYFSYPLSVRWSAGSKLLAGYNYYPSNTLPAPLAKLSRQEGYGIGTGLSLSFMANRSMGVKFFTDYNLISPPVQTKSKLQQIITLGASANIIF